MDDAFWNFLVGVMGMSKVDLLKLSVAVSMCATSGFRTHLFEAELRTVAELDLDTLKDDLQHKSQLGRGAGLRLVYHLRLLSAPPELMAARTKPRSRRMTSLRTCICRWDRIVSRLHASRPNGSICAATSALKGGREACFMEPVASKKCEKRKRRSRRNGRLTTSVAMLSLVYVSELLSILLLCLLLARAASDLCPRAHLEDL